MKCASKTPPRIPLSVVQRYIAAFDKEDTVPLAVVVVPCKLVIKIGNRNPFNIKTSAKIPTAIAMLGEKGVTTYSAHKVSKPTKRERANPHLALVYYQTKFLSDFLCQ